MNKSTNKNGKKDNKGKKNKKNKKNERKKKEVSPDDKRRPVTSEQSS